MKTVLHALDAVEAYLIKGLLANEGISSAVLGEHLLGGIGELPTTGLISVVVDDADYEQAANVLKSWEQAKLTA